jgi:hypothetical protein
MLLFIKELNDFETEKQYVDWLWLALAEFYSNDKTVRYRSGLYRFMSKTLAESTVDALAKVYVKHITADKKHLFRTAIGKVLKKCTEKGSVAVAPIVDDLSYLICQINAIEALDGLLAVMSCEPLITAEPELLYNCLSVMRSMDPCNELFDFASKLVELPTFDDGYIFVAIKVMADCRPEQAEKIADRLGQRITNLYDEVKRLNAAEESAYWETIRSLFRSKQNRVILDRISVYSK